ncbi:DNA cytosine methyltransferase, partial [Escherichia coli]
MDDKTRALLGDHEAAKLAHLSLFSGIGGLDLAAEWAGFTTVGQCEWADYPTKVLEKHWPDVPRWRDIRTLTKESFHEKTGLRTVDIISGGFPCQPFSVAGKRRGKEDDRYLWPEMLRVISDLRPAWVVGENVAGIVNMALGQVCADLESEDYSVQAFIIPACAVDAPHRRDRCAIIGCRALERK